VRRLRRLVQKRALRWSEGVCVLEGPDLVSAALDAAVEFEALFVDARHVDDVEIATLSVRASAQGVRIFALESGVLERVADTQTPQPVIAVVRFVVSDVRQLSVDGLILVLHEMRDPGNAGTVIRSADAAGVRAVIFTGQSVDPFNPKTLRATAGAIFRIPIAVGSLSEVLEHHAQRGARTLATVVRDGASHRTVDFTKPAVVVIGNEAGGLDPSSVALCHGSITIPMTGHGESLNAAVAASLIAFEAMQQRQDAVAPPRPPSL
jgi:TrmH family RNA methyltransferase